MFTRGKRGFRQLTVPFTLYMAPMSPIPRTFRDALTDKNWRDAMTEEYSTLLTNNIWDLVPRPPGANVVTDKWVYRHKFCSDGSLERYKA